MAWIQNDIYKWEQCKNIKCSMDNYDDDDDGEGDDTPEKQTKFYNFYSKLICYILGKHSFPGVMLLSLYYASLCD